MLTLRLYLNIGILYEDNRDFQKAYDYFVKWHETCQEVRGSVKCTAAWLAQLVERRTAVREVEGSSPRPDQHSGS